MTKLSIKDRQNELRRFNRRTLTIVLGMFFLLLLLIARLFYLQIIEHRRYTTLSKQNQLSYITIAPKRGLIYGRDGTLLAKNIPVSSLDIIPYKVKNMRATIDKLRTIIPLTQDDIIGFYKLMSHKSPYGPVPLKLDLTPKEVAQFAVNRWRFPGVVIDARLMRYYPLGPTFSHVVGYMGRINAEELASVNAVNYSATDYIGKLGIEHYYETQLHGQIGNQEVETDASGRVVRVLKRTPPIAGDNIYLTIDAKLQKIAVQSLDGIPGAVVAINPNNGAVLAMVSYPQFNPNLFVKGISEKDYSALLHGKDRPLYNRAIRGLFAPGSTVKPIFALEALKTDVIQKNTQFYDPGYFILGGHKFHNWYRPGFGWIDLTNAIVVSDDVYFYNVAVKLGIKRMDTILHEFGYGQPTGIDLDHALSGVLPGPQWKLKSIHHPWYTGDTVNQGIGQGYLLVTPLQLADATAAIAMHGKRFQPHLLYKMVLPNGTVITQPPIALPSVEAPESDWNFVIHAMQEVIKSPRGTGFEFGRNAPYTVAAKTGTAQVYSFVKGGRYNQQDLPSRLRANSLFIAFAPIDHPKIAVVTITEHSEQAFKAARTIMDYYLLTQHHLHDTDATNSASQTS